ncbi:hypothetical protein BLNAU_11574 [Blattamonas nauphoetae]|uniref:Transmembrane protein n=1 Tax=Blattamonas nauphoetae TaxID=2049346 RepID=A0ABQ9XSE8_9EUKA|nr:hypothetical protein BLNAU_11574 [Blattamonas nauphoetae]
MNLEAVQYWVFFVISIINIGCIAYCCIKLQPLPKFKLAVVALVFFFMQTLEAILHLIPDWFPDLKTFFVWFSYLHYVEQPIYLNILLYVLYHKNQDKSFAIVRFVLPLCIVSSLLGFSRIISNENISCEPGSELFCGPTNDMVKEGYNVLWTLKLRKQGPLTPSSFTNNLLVHGPAILLGELPVIIASIVHLICGTIYLSFFTVNGKEFNLTFDPIMSTYAIVLVLLYLKKEKNPKETEQNGEESSSSVVTDTQSAEESPIRQRSVVRE